MKIHTENGRTICDLGDGTVWSFEDHASEVPRAVFNALRARAAELEKNAKKAWEECHAMSSELSKANQDRDRWRECAVHLDYRGADYCVAIHKELDGLQADNAEHREQMSKLLKTWKSRATRAEKAEADLDAEREAHNAAQARCEALEKEKDDAWHQGFAIAAAVVCDLSGSLNSHEVFTENGVTWEHLKAHKVDPYDLKRIGRDLKRHGLSIIGRTPLAERRKAALAAVEE